MMKKTGRKRLIAVCILAACVSAPILWRARRAAGPVGGRKSFLIKARQYAYDPPRIFVNKGDEVRIRLASLDVIHGFYMEGYDIDAEIHPTEGSFLLRHPSREKDYKPVEEIVFIADKTGKFRYRCSHTCGFLHPFMLGEMIVSPNTLFPVGIGLAVGILLSGFVLVWPFGKTDDGNPVRQGPPREGRKADGT